MDEAAVQEAHAEAKEAKTTLVAYLIANELAEPRDVAIAASHEFGVPLLDLDFADIDLDAVRLVSEKILTKHRVLPLLKRGKRLFVAVSDPTNLQAVDKKKGPSDPVGGAFFLVFRHGEILGSCLKKNTARIPDGTSYRIHAA